MQQGIQTQAKE